MNNWHLEIAIPVIAIAVYILSSLIRNVEDDKKTNRPRSGPGGSRPARPTSDIDRFLEEIQRRRRQTEERKQPEAAEVVPIPASRPPEAPRVRRKPRPVPTEMPPRRPLVPLTREPIEVEPVVVVVENALPAQVWPQPVQVPATPTFPQVQVQPPKPPLPPPPPAPGTIQHGPSPALLQLVTWIRSPQSLRTAILLREVLDRPRCQRRR